MNAIVDISKFPAHEFSMDIIELPGGGYQVNWRITGKTRRYLKRKAAREGRTLEEWIDHHLMPAFDPEEPDSDPQE